MAELGREFPEVKKEGYDNKTLQKNQLSKSKRNQTGNDPDHILQGCWRRLKLKSKIEDYLQRHEVRETSRGNVEVIRRKEKNITKKEDNQEYSKFVYFTILSHKTLPWYRPISQGMTQNMFFSFRYSP